MSRDTADTWRCAVLFAAGVAVGTFACVALPRAAEWRSRCSADSRADAPPLLGRMHARGVAPQPPPHQLSLDDPLVAEALTRNVQFFGHTGQARVCGAFVVVVGLGGVGSHAASMLLRSGVGRLRVVDFDQVTLSSLNRSAVAERSDVGLPKATVLKNHFERISPESRVDARVAMFTSDTAASLLGEWDGDPPDCVVDAIDHVVTKVALLEACHARGLPVLCCAGAGGKADPSRLTVCSLGDSARDPLARALRHALRRRLGRAADELPVLFSTEPPRCGLLPVDPATAEALRTVPGFRVRAMPVLGTTPAAFGAAAAAWALCRLAGAPLAMAPPAFAAPEQVAQQLERLLDRERLRFGTDEGVRVDPCDVGYVMAELWKCRSARCAAPALPGAPRDNTHKAVYRSTQGLVLTRWDDARPAGVDNLVLLTFDEAEAHEKGGGAAAARVEEPAWAAAVDAALARASRDHLITTPPAG